MARLRRSHCNGPGLRRRRRGQGFTYSWDDGRPVTDTAHLDPGPMVTSRPSEPMPPVGGGTGITTPGERSGTRSNWSG